MPQPVQLPLETKPKKSEYIALCVPRLEDGDPGTVFDGNMTHGRTFMT